MSNEDLIIIESKSNIVRSVTIRDHRKKVREELLIELADVFANTDNKEWHNWEISDFLNSYRANE